MSEVLGNGLKRIKQGTGIVLVSDRMDSLGEVQSYLEENGAEQSTELMNGSDSQIHTQYNIHNCSVKIAPLNNGYGVRVDQSMQRPIYESGMVEKVADDIGRIIGSHEN